MYKRQFQGRLDKVAFYQLALPIEVKSGRNNSSLSRLRGFAEIFKDCVSLLGVTGGVALEKHLTAGAKAWMVDNKFKPTSSCDFRNAPGLSRIHI